MNVHKGILISILLIALLSTYRGEGINCEKIPMITILNEINDGKKINYDSKIIIGDLKLNTSSVRNAVNSSIKITNSSIEGSVDFSNIIFEDIIDFSKTTFGKHVNITDCKFKKTVCFYSSVFENKILFEDSQFLGDAVFRFAQFHAKAEWINFTFSGFSCFENCTFEQDAYFIKPVFCQTVSFENTKFNEVVDFYKSNFSEVIYIGSLFNEDATFEGSLFGKDANFRKCSFNQTANFARSRFGGDAVFKAAKFEGTARFDECKFSEENYASFDNAVFNGTLYLNGTRYKNLYLRWHNINKLAYNEEAYHAIMKNFRDLGYFEDLDNAYYRYRVERRNIPWPGVEDHEESILKTLDFFLEKTYGYGTKPLYAIGWIFLVITVFGFLWFLIEIKALQKFLQFIMQKIWVALNWLQSSLYRTPRCLRYLNIFGKLISKFVDAIFCSFILFLSSIKPFDEKLLISLYPKNPTNMQKLLMTLEMALGLILSLLFLIALSVTVIRPMLYNIV